MAENNRDTHVTRETHVEKSRGSGMAFIVGGLVVAVLVIALLIPNHFNDPVLVTQDPLPGGRKRSPIPYLNPVGGP